MTLEEPTAGDIIVEDTNLWKMERAGKMVPANDKHLRSIRGEIGMVFQHFNLFLHMTIIDNCMTALVHVKDVPKKKARKASEEMLIKVGLEEHMLKYRDQFSGGRKLSLDMS